MLLPPSEKDRRCGFVVNGPDNPNGFAVRVCDLRVPAGVDGFAEGEANARLIAAAPELLEACQWFDTDRDPDDKGFAEWFDEARKQAREAIAKATS